MRTQENKIAKIRKAIDEENVSLGELAELQAIAATHPQLFADDALLAEWAGIPEEEWRKMADTKTRWTVAPYYAPREDADPLGVFRIKEVEAEAQKWDDTLPDTEPGSEEEQSALDRRDAVTESARRLIAAAPDLLEALKNAREDLSELAQLVQSGSFDAAEDWIEANAAQINVTLSRVIANAEGSDQ